MRQHVSANPTATRASNEGARLYAASAEKIAAAMGRGPEPIVRETMIYFGFKEAAVFAQRDQDATAHQAGVARETAARPIARQVPHDHALVVNGASGQVMSVVEDAWAVINAAKNGLIKPSI